MVVRAPLDRCVIGRQAREPTLKIYICIALESWHSIVAKVTTFECKKISSALIPLSENPGIGGATRTGIII